jgi:hypothetical protein
LVTIKFGRLLGGFGIFLKLLEMPIDDIANSNPSFLSVSNFFGRVFLKLTNELSSCMFAQAFEIK